MASSAERDLYPRQPKAGPRALDLSDYSALGPSPPVRVLPVNPIRKPVKFSLSGGHHKPENTVNCVPPPKSRPLTNGHLDSSSSRSSALEGHGSQSVQDAFDVSSGLYASSSGLRESASGSGKTVENSIAYPTPDTPSSSSAISPKHAAGGLKENVDVIPPKQAPSFGFMSDKDEVSTFAPPPPSNTPPPAPPPPEEHNPSSSLQVITPTQSRCTTPEPSTMIIPRGSTPPPPYETVTLKPSYRIIWDPILHAKSPKDREKKPVKRYNGEALDGEEPIVVRDPRVKTADGCFLGRGSRRHRTELYQFPEYKVRHAYRHNLGIDI